MVTVASVYIVYLQMTAMIQTSVRNAILNTQMSIVILDSFVQFANSTIVLAQGDHTPNANFGIETNNHGEDYAKDCG